MDDLRKKALWMALLGFALGALVGVVILLLPGVDGYLSEPDHRLMMVLYLAMSGLYGAVNMGTAALYGVEDWSILRCTATHFAICIGSTVLFFGTMILAGWMSVPPLGACLVMLLAFLTVYFLIWFLQYLSYRQKVRTMNAKLRKWKAHRK